MESSLNRIKPKLRTEGRVTGNFGRNKVEGKRSTLEISKATMKKENLRIPKQDEVFARLAEAYRKTTDPKMKAFLEDTLRKKNAQLGNLSTNRSPKKYSF